MSYVKPIISGILLFSLIYLLNQPISMGETNVPPLGDFFNPFSGFWQNADAHSGRDIIVESEINQDEIVIQYDERGVPHIFASNLEDLIFAQGYAIARERLWQMDITTRAIEGKTAEVLGAASLDQDMRARQRGLPRAARLADESWKKNQDGYLLFERFSQGINHYINTLRPADIPLEFKLLNYEPQEWSPYRTSLFIKAMAVTLNAAHIDIPSSNARTIFGEEKFNDLYPDKNKKQSPIIRDREWKDPSVTFEEEVLEMLGSIFESNERSQHEAFIGSNNFAVSGEKSASGNAILANDPHLKLTLPSIWVEMHLVCPEMNVYGVALPGMPGITLGFNEQISWGQTNVGQDVLDIYEVEWEGDNYNSYKVDGESLQTERVVEHFVVRDGDNATDTVLYTIWGPIKKEEGRQTKLAQRWVSSDEPSPAEADVYLGINRAKNHAEFQEAISNFSTPAQNFIFSSTNGDIAMTVAGNLPIKGDQQGRFIQDGSTRKSAWKGYITFDELPQELNPKRNYVASANQHSADETYPYYYNGGFEDFRGRYINRTLENMKEVSTEDLMNLQLDAYSLKAEEALPLLLDNLQIESLTKKEVEVVKALEDWNYVYAANSLAATYFEVWWMKFYQTAFDEIYQIRKETDIPWIEAYRLIEMMEDDHAILDIEETEEVERLSDIVQVSFKGVGFDSLDLKAWSEHRNTTIQHLTNIPSLSYDNVTSPGHGNTPNAISSQHGPSWRMVVEMSTPIKAFGIYPGGISGNPGSPYYDHFVDDWSKGQYYELNNSRDKDKIESKSRITFKGRK